MTDTGSIDPRELADLLRADPLVNDAEVVPGVESATATAVIAPQGFHPGHVLRERVMSLAGPVGTHIAVVVVAAVPRTPDGVLDQQEVRTAAARPGACYRYEAPATEAERALVELVCEVLTDVQVASVTDSLTALGGDSLTAIELIVRIRERFGVDIDPQQVFGADSLRDLAAVLTAAAPQWSPV